MLMVLLRFYASSVGVIMKKIIPLIVCCMVTGCAFLGEDNQAQQNPANQALESANVIIKQNPNNYLGYYLAAQAFQQLNESSEVNSNYQKALELNSSSIEVNLGYANYLCQVESYSQAQIYYDKLSNSAQNLVTFYINYGDCLTSQNKLEEAINSYQKALKIDPTSQGAYLGLIYAFNLLAKYTDAYHLINDYPNSPSKDFLQLKIFTLQGLIASNSTLYDKNELDEQLQIAQAKLLSYQQESSVESSPYAESNQLISPLVVSATVESNSVIENRLPQPVSSSETKEIKQSRYQPLDDRIQSQDGRKYVVLIDGDTLYNLALRSKVSISQLMQINKLTKNNIVIGSKFYLN